MSFNCPLTPPPTDRLPALDGLRGVAIVLVMLCHYTEAGRHPFFDVTRGGWCGVDLFFVLSGFLVTGILIDARSRAHALRNFYARRTLRIFPLYYAFLAVGLLLLPALKPAHELGLERAVDGQGWLWSYTTNFAQAWSGDWIFNTGRLRMHHFWSLAVEEQFYLLWPWIVLFASPRTLWRVCLLAVAGAPLLRGVLLWSGANPLAALVLMPSRMDALAAGALLAMLVREPDGAWRARRLASGLMIVGAGILGAVWGWRGNPFNLSDPVVVTVVPAALAAGFTGAAALAATSSGQSWAYRLCTARPLTGLGTISYGLYILHLPVLSFGGRWVNPGMLTSAVGSELGGVLLFTLLGIGVSAGLATMSWICFERPILKLKRFFEYHPAGGLRSTGDAASVAGLTGRFSDADGGEPPDSTVAALLAQPRKEAL